MKDVALILHAGDVGRTEVIHKLERIAPVQAVRGNMDAGLRPPRFPLRRLVQVEQVAILMTHFGLWSAELETWLRRSMAWSAPTYLSTAIATEQVSDGRTEHYISILALPDSHG